MSNPFARMQEYFTAPNRNTHDWSFQNNLTLKMGKLTPCCYIPLTPGESVRIDPTFGFNFEPMVFPVQTRMRAHLHFFYVRYKDLYKDWLDKFGMTKQGLEMPYMKLTEENRDMVNTGELGDYLNIPTVTYGSYGSMVESSFSLRLFNFALKTYEYDYFQTLVSFPEVGEQLLSAFPNLDFINKKPVSETIGFVSVIPTNNIPGWSTDSLSLFQLLGNNISEWNNSRICYCDTIGNVISYQEINLTIGTSELYQLEHVPENTAYIALCFSPKSEWVSFNVFQGTSIKFSCSASKDYGIENKELSLDQLPFCSYMNPDGERLVNFPFRAYEFVYNSFYRDERNNPYKIDGQVEYNKYLPSTDGGADTYHYKLRNANWEQDFLTTATDSPQFGVAPLVGVTSTGTMTFADEDGNTYTAQAKVGDDGDTITGISVHSPDMPVGTLRALIDTVSSGISISDFRNVNALQRLLEKRMRHGLKYVDMVQASYGVRPKNLEISMPEFIGGVNHDVIVNAVSQTVDTENVPLGTKGGTASVIGGSSHDISCYADDFGCIIGIVYIAPVPNYSQLLPKHFFASEALDYFHPEFGHIGYQPIYNKEVAPLQFFRDDKANNTDNYNSVFGYQRPWYDMISKTDEVHGNYRNNKRRYLINRVFDTPPALTEDFLLVDANQVNDVFAVTEDTDKIFGQVYFRIKRKNAVPTLSIPRLES